jgi:hypothetical protein
MTDGEKPEEFGFGWTFSPYMVDRCCQLGYFPMSLLVDWIFVLGRKGDERG